MNCLETRNSQNDRIRDLVQEAVNGEHNKEILPNSSYSFDPEAQAEYFSHARNNMQMDIAHQIMEEQQQLDECVVLGVLKKNGWLQ